MNSHDNDAERNVCFQSANSSTSSDNIALNNVFNGIDFDDDSLWESIDKVEDEEVLDEIFSKLSKEYEIKVDELKKIQQHRVELKSVIDAGKYRVAELEELRNEEQQKCEDLQKVISEKRLELEALNSQKVADLDNFEAEIAKKSENFVNAPREYDSKALKQEVSELEKELAEKILELNQYKEEMIKEKAKFQEITSDAAVFTPLKKMFEEDAADINNLNKELKLEVEQLSSDLNTLRVKCELFAKLNSN